MTIHIAIRRTLFTAIAALILALAYSYTPPPAQAHAPTSGTRCMIYAQIASIVSGKPARVHRVECAIAGEVHRCEHARVSPGMTSATCKGLVLAARDDRRVPTSWAWNPALHELLDRESSGNPNAINDSSGACGLFQRLQMHPKPPCPWPASGRGTSRERVGATAYVQARNGYRYILDRPGYGTPEKALEFHGNNGWY